MREGRSGRSTATTVSIARAGERNANAGAWRARRCRLPMACTRSTTATLEPRPSDRFGTDAAGLRDLEFGVEARPPAADNVAELGVLPVAKLRAVIGDIHEVPVRVLEVPDEPHASSQGKTRRAPKGKVGLERTISRPADSRDGTSAGSRGRVASFNLSPYRVALFYFQKCERYLLGMHDTARTTGGGQPRVAPTSMSTSRGDDARAKRRVDPSDRAEEVPGRLPRCHTRVRQLAQGRSCLLHQDDRWGSAEAVNGLAARLATVADSDRSALGA